MQATTGVDKTKASGMLPTSTEAIKNSIAKPKYNTKKLSMLSLFVRLGKQGLNCFQAANHHHDYVLRTTISDLQKDYGIEFSRKYERVPNAFGKYTDCMRYWLDDENKAKAMEILSIKEEV